MKQKNRYWKKRKGKLNLSDLINNNPGEKQNSIIFKNKNNFKGQSKRKRNNWRIELIR